MRILVHRSTGRIGLLTNYNIAKRELTIEIEEGWLTIIYNERLSPAQAVAIYFEDVGVL